MTQPNASEQDRIPIAQIEAAINVWRKRNPSMFDTDVLVLCAEARCLADLYGELIFTRGTSVSRDSLSQAQLAALTGALA